MRASEEQFRNAMSYSAIGMALVSPSGAFLTVNDAICDIVGYSAEELLALTFQDITDPDDLGRDMSLLSDLIAGGIRSYQMEKRYIRKDGAIVWVRLTVAAVRRPDGSAQHLISQIENIDKHKKNEAELQATAARLAESNHLLTLAEEMAHVGHWSVRLADGMITSSDEVLRIHGLPPGKAPSLHEVLDRFYPDRDQPRYAQAMQALAEGRAFEAEGRLVRQDGTPCHVAAIARPVQGPDGAVTGVIGVIQDITARKQAEEERELQLQQLQDSMARLKRQSADLSRMATDLAAARDAAESANRAKSEFLTAMSHELRTPLNGVLGFAQLLSGSYFGALNTKQSEFVDAILSSGNHLLELINDVLELTRIEAGNMAVTIEPTDPVAVVKSIVTTLEPMARRFLVRLRSAEREDGSTIVMADRTRLAQALLNLGSNAIKYNRPGGSVSFVVGEPVDGWTRLSVDDTGIGIPEARFPELFKPFSRLGAERKAIEGTGVGLSLTRRLVELMGGRIGFRSAPDIGSSFWIELPTVAGGGFRQTEKSTARIVSGLIG
jgi:PAS domain S-box-containing protein